MNHFSLAVDTRDPRVPENRKRLRAFILSPEPTGERSLNKYPIRASAEAALAQMPDTTGIYVAETIPL